jgi:hypothetical protein
MGDADLMRNLWLWQVEEKHFRRVLKDSLLDHRRWFPHWFEAAKFRFLLRATLLRRRIVFGLASLIGIKLRA